MPPTTILWDALSTRIGQEIGVSDWLTVDQERIDAFAEVTEDRQWIHVDPVRSARQSPYRATIAHGFLTLSLLSHLHGQAVRIEGPFTRVINYGLNRVRFPVAVRAGDQVRGHSFLAAMENVPGGVQLTWGITIEVQGQVKPALAAEWIVRLYRDAGP